MFSHDAPPPPRLSPLRLRAARGFTLMEAMISIGLCALAFSIFYTAIAQGFRIVKNARAHAAASQLLEQRFEALRARTFWSSMITSRGLQAAVSEQPINRAVLTDCSEAYDVAAYPGGSTAFAVTRHPDGSVTTSGAPLPTSQRAVKITGAIVWGKAGAGPRHTRVVSTVFTKGGI
jgi:Tfp pilus assembly protein PilV